MTYQVDDRGYYGEFGGAFIPEMLYPNVEEFLNGILRSLKSRNFRRSFKHYSRTM